jgi:hypothetical protein
MKFRTEVEVASWHHKIDYNDTILCLGSCFATNIAERLAERKWPLMSLRSSELTLEEVFINMTNDAYRDATLVKKVKGGNH